MPVGHVDPRVNKHLQHEKSADRQREREDIARRIQQGEKPWQEHEGVMSVVGAVMDLEFPCSFDQIRRAAGRREVNTTRHVSHPLKEVLDVLEPRLNLTVDPFVEGDKVPSVPDFQKIVQNHWQAVRFLDIPESQRPRTGGVRR